MSLNLDEKDDLASPNYYPSFITFPTVITKISSARGDKNSASSKQEKVIHGTRLIPQHYKRVKKLYKRPNI